MARWLRRDRDEWTPRLVCRAPGLLSLAMIVVGASVPAAGGTSNDAGSTQSDGGSTYHALRLDRNVCGRNSLLVVLNFLTGQHYDEALARSLPDDGAPFSLSELQEAARQCGFQTRLVHWREKPSARFMCPSVVHVRSNRAAVTPDHFIACFGETADGVCVGEFPNAPFVMSRTRFNEYWDGDVLYIDRQQGTALAQLWRARMWRVLAASLGGVLLAAAVTLGVVRMRSRQRTAGVHR